MWSDAPPQGVDLEAWRIASERHSQEQTAYEGKTEGARKVYATAEPHRGSWDRTVSAYLFTKSVSAGVGLVLAPLLLMGAPVSSQSLFPAALLALVFLALTNLLLVYKLERRERFIYVLIRPQWRSWLVRGAYIMMGYGALQSIAFLIAWTRGRPPSILMVLILLFALGTAVYSAFLFNQAKGRDLWQSPVLPLHLISHAIIAGAAALGLAAFMASSLSPLLPTMSRVLAGGLAVSLLALGAEFFSRHQTADAEAAAKMITSGKFRVRFWLWVFFGCHLVPIVLLAAGAFLPAAILALVGIALFEDIFVEAGQALPLA